jgi:hypothetical protein
VNSCVWYKSADFTKNRGKFILRVKRAKKCIFFGLPEGNNPIPYTRQARTVVAVIDGLRKGLSVACFPIKIRIPE